MHRCCVVAVLCYALLCCAVLAVLYGVQKNLPSPAARSAQPFRFSHFLGFLFFAFLHFRFFRLRIKEWRLSGNASLSSTVTTTTTTTTSAVAAVVVVVVVVVGDGGRCAGDAQRRTWKSPKKQRQLSFRGIHWVAAVADQRWLVVAAGGMLSVWNWNHHRQAHHGSNSSVPEWTCTRPSIVVVDGNCVSV
jgi:hypothetical protein